MRRIIFSILLVLVARVSRADDIMMTGPKAEQVKKEIIDLLQEDVKAFDQGGKVAADFIDRHEVDSILYLSSTNEKMISKAERVKQWRSGERKIISHRRYDIRVRVYDNGNVAVADFKNDIEAHENGKDTKPATLHVLRVYVKDKGLWRTVVFDMFR